MDSIEPGQDPSVVHGIDVLTLAGRFEGTQGAFAPFSTGGGPPRRIGGRFCPFCAGTIPQEFVFCTHCGRDV
jgi:hypothetical protein